LHEKDYTLNDESVLDDLGSYPQENQTVLCVYGVGARCLGVGGWVTKTDILRYTVPKPVELIETMQRSLKLYSFDEIAVKLVERIRSHFEFPHYVHLTPRKDKRHSDALELHTPKKKAYP
jgi:hypothetical protein